MERRTFVKNSSLATVGGLTVLNFPLFKKNAPATVRTYPAPPGAPISSDYIVEVNGQPVDVYSTPTRHGGNPCYYGYFDFVGMIRIEITAAWCDSLRSATIHPLSCGITPQVSGKKVSLFGRESSR